MHALQSLQVHDFGPLNDLARDLYRRLKTGCDKYSSWKHFAAESGSNLIYQFSQIFADSVFLGGAPARVGDIISKNFMHMLSLRKLKMQLGSTLRGSLYGSLVGFAAAAYISAQIADMLAGLFQIPFQNASGVNSVLGDLTSELAPGGALAVDMNMILVYIGIMVIIHAVVSALIIKIVDGGTPYAMFFDIVCMIWLGAIVSIVLPWGVQLMLPGLNELLVAT
jgi:flagellar protein FlaJ